MLLFELFRSFGSAVARAFALFYEWLKVHGTTDLILLAFVSTVIALIFLKRMRK